MLGRPKKYTVRQALQRFQLLRRGRSHAYNIYSAKWALLWGDRDVRSITVAELREWRTVRARTASPGTVHIQMCILSGAFEQAIEDGVSIENPVRKLGWNNVPSIRQKYFSIDEESQLHAIMDSNLRDYASFAAVTGLRIGEQLGIQWLDRQDGILWVRAGKTEKGRWIPLHPDAAAILDARKRLALPFPRTYRQVAGPFTRALGRLGIKGACWHCWRHTFASRLVARGVSLYHVSRLLGHSTLSMTSRYAHLAMDDLVSAVNLLQRKNHAPDQETPDKGGTTHELVD